MGFPGGSEVKASACNAGDLGSIPGSGRFLAWRIPWVEEPGGLQSKSQTRLSNFTFTSQVQFLGQEDLLEKGIATHSSILAWRIAWTEEPDWL